MKLHPAINNLLREDSFACFGPRKAASDLQFKQICSHNVGEG
jgi:hypothetical protein